MRKFICSSFELDLSPYKITDTAENPWFTGNYFAKYSYPFEIIPDDALERALGLVSHHNADAETLFEGIYVHGDIMEAAVLEIEEIERGLSVTVRYGFEEFPNFSKKLSELPLLRQAVDNIYTHAAAIIPQTWPAVNYNFPQLHTDKIDTESEGTVWEAFEKIINNYRDGAFLVNEVDLETDTTYNRNIIQPLPYLLYVIKAGIEAAGYTLHGDILEHDVIKKMLVYCDTNYFTTVTQESIQLLVPATEYDTIQTNSGFEFITTNREVEILNPGKYRITGTVTLRGSAGLAQLLAFCRIYYRDELLQQKTVHTNTSWNVDIIFETLSDLDPNYLRFEHYGLYKETDITFDIWVNPIRLHDDSGEAIPTIINLNEVDLTRAVPEMTFGDLVKVVLGLFNLDMTPVGNEIWINRVAREIQERPVLDLSSYEVKFPNRKFSKGNSFLFRYQEVESEDYTFAEVFQNKDGIVNSDYVTDDKTTDMTVNALPLPLMLRNSVQTAHAFLQDNSKPFFVLYNGLTGGLNLAKDPAQLLIPALHQANYIDWFEARINSVAYKWTFLAWYEQLAGLTAKSRVHAYGQNLLMQSLQKTEVRPDLFEVEIEAVVFK